MNEGILGAINWAAVFGIVTAFFVIITLIAGVTMAPKWKKLTFAQIAHEYGIILVLWVMSYVALGGGALALAKGTSGQVDNIAPGTVQQQQDGQQGRGSDGR